MGSSNENSAFGPVLNPWNRARVPGGSSGGSAAAVAAGLAPWALGTDTGGSIRQPAALCGIVGLKPTYGAVSRYGMIAFASSLDQAGPLTRDVTDAALLLRHMVGRDECDATSLGHPEEIALPTAESLAGVRLGVPEELTGEGIDPGVLDAFRGALSRAQELGAEIHDVRLPHAPHGLSAYYVLAPAEASSNLARFDGVRYGLRAENAEDLFALYTHTRHDGFGAEVKRRIMLGTYALSAGYYDAYYGRAQRVRTKIVADFDAAFADVDFILTPTSPTVAFPLGERTGDPWSMYINDFCTVPMSLAGIPAISIPCGLAGDGGAPRSESGSGGSPSGCRSLARCSARTACSTPPLRWSGRSASTGRGRGSGSRREMSAVEYEPVIGLEIHIQLATATKMFCGCALSFGEPPNTRTCPVCLGLPGSLPVANARAVHFGLMIGLALDSELAPRSIFHRKNYFYPDLPKGYQISQYDEPLCLGGRLGEVRIHRVHLEEDAAKLVHVGASGRIHGSDASIVDFNRGGTPLAEIVTEPDLRSAEAAGEWLRLLRTTMRVLGVSDVNMEEGSLRCDANISLRPAGSEQLGVKTELKNMNSFRFIERGIRAELARQEAILRAGGRVELQTLHFDPASERITSLRSKEEAHDYRYFPEPDLVPVAIDAAMLDAARAALPELPAARAERFEREIGLSADSAHLLAFRTGLGDYFEAALAAVVDPAPPAQALANWISGDLVARLTGGETVTDAGETGGAGGDPLSSRAQPHALAVLVGLVAAKRISVGAGRQVLDRLVAKGGDPAAIVEAEGLAAIDGGDELAAIVASALAAHPEAAANMRAGNAKAIGPIVGHVMRATKGRADGGAVTQLVHEQLGI